MTKNKPKVIRRSGNQGAIVIPGRNDIAQHITDETETNGVTKGIEACYEIQTGLFLSPGAVMYIQRGAMREYLEDERRQELAMLYGMAVHSSEFYELLENIRIDQNLVVMEDDTGVYVMRRGEQMPDKSKNPFWEMVEPIIINEGSVNESCRTRLESALVGRHRDNPFQSSDRFTEGEPLSPYAFLATASPVHRKRFDRPRLITEKTEE